MSKRQLSKSSRSRIRGPRFNPYITMRKLDAVMENETGSQAIRRFVSPKNYETLLGLGQLANQHANGEFQAFEHSETGLTLMQKSEIDTIRTPDASRLGRFSFQISREIIKDMLPETAEEDTLIVLRNFGISKPKRGKRYLIAHVVKAADVRAERTALQEGVDRYERVSHDWEDYRTHITLGSFNAKGVKDIHHQLPKLLSQEFSAEKITLQPAV